MTLTADDLHKVFVENEDLCRQIQIMVPHLASQGVTKELHDKLKYWQVYGIDSEVYLDGGGFLETSRAHMALDFLHEFGDKQFLLFIDADMVPDPLLPLTLARHRKHVVGGVAMSIAEKHGPMLCFTAKDTSGKWRFPCLHSGVKIPQKGLIPVGHCGTGAMCIRRDVVQSFTFQAGDMPFYVREDIRVEGAQTGRLVRGEDIEFCWQVRRKGFNVYVDAEAHVGHRKPIVLRWAEEAVDPSLSAESFVLPPQGMRIADRYE